MTPLPPTSKRNARKLLLYICGSKEKYRQLRDLHALSTHSKGKHDCRKGSFDSIDLIFLGIKQCCAKGGYQANQDLQHALSLPYDSLVELVEHLKACLEIALFRTGMTFLVALHTEFN